MQKIIPMDRSTEDKEYKNGQLVWSRLFFKSSQEISTSSLVLLEALPWLPPDQLFNFIGAVVKYKCIIDFNPWLVISGGNALWEYLFQKTAPSSVWDNVDTRPLLAPFWLIRAYLLRLVPGIVFCLTEILLSSMVENRREGADKIVMSEETDVRKSVQGGN